jgi:hypothetical protein
MQNIWKIVFILGNDGKMAKIHGGLVNYHGLDRKLGQKYVYLRPVAGDDNMADHTSM